ncbi:hypothetical protein Tco_0705270 [Tanacetum coccineum]|uniref:DUF4283 domain-containing protein n=1 Tax=Tanacetum coccineum TaxID=301880 RepID=A0ABQ4Y443_9ASTR
MNPPAMVWEVEETYFASPLRGADIENVGMESQVGGLHSKNQKMEGNFTRMELDKLVADENRAGNEADGCEEVQSSITDGNQSMDSPTVEDTKVADDEFVSQPGERDANVNLNIEYDCSNEAATWNSTPNDATSSLHMDNTCSNEAAPTPNAAATGPKNFPHSNPVSFASIFNSKQVNKKLNFRSFVNEERVENSDTMLSKAAMESIKNRYVNSLVGYFVGKSLAFPVVQNYVNNTWGKFGLQKVMRNDGGVFIFKFASKEGLEQVLQRGPWMIRKSPIILTKWSSSLSLKRCEVTSVAVWVRLHGVPILAYSEDGLSLIATQIGKPLLLDAFTSSMCVESRSRISFARALIKVSSESELTSKVTMAIPNEEGDGYTKEHVKETIFNDPSTTKHVGTSTTMDTSSDGFMDVTQKKNKGTKASVESGADLATKGQMGTNSSINKVNGPSTSNSFDILNKVDIGDECGISSSTASEHTPSTWNEDFESDDEVDEVIFPKGNNVSSNKPPLLPLPSANSNSKANPATALKSPVRKQLTQKEYEKKRAKNMCFYCDKKFVPGHKCKGKLFSLVVLPMKELDEEFEDAQEELDDL